MRQLHQRRSVEARLRPMQVHAIVGVRLRNVRLLVYPIALETVVNVSLNRALVACALLLAGCTDPVNRWSAPGPESMKVAGLEDCTVHRVNTGTQTMIVVRCPHSDTTTNQQHGKTRRSVTVTSK